MTHEEPSLEDVLERAADLQRLVPGAVLVGGSAAAFHVGHRRSLDHDHVLPDLADRFDTILAHLEAVGDWSMTRAQPGKIILGELGGIETGLRQLFRQRPLETEHVEVRGKALTIPTTSETLRIKAWLALTRNQTRDYVDIAALTDHLGLEHAARTLVAMDEYYDDLNEGQEAVATQLLRQLADPRPRDVTVTRELASYKSLDRRWHDWGAITSLLRRLAQEMLR